jgi:hypothetical protein
MLAVDDSEAGSAQEPTMVMPTWPVRFDGVPTKVDPRRCFTSTPPRWSPTGSVSTPLPSHS